MVAPIQSGRIGGSNPVGSRPDAVGGDSGQSFDDALRRATEDLTRATSSIAPPTLPDAAAALHAIEQAAVSLERAHTHIASARAYFQSAGQPRPGGQGFDSRG